MRIGTLLVTGLLTVAGCAHSNSTANSALDSTKEGFSTAYGAVKTGARATANAGGWVLSKAADGTVSVMRAAHLRSAANYTEDRAITSKIKGNYGLDPDVKARQINVDTDHGVVTLTGTVDNWWTAEKAIRTALDEPGVIEVRSNLQFPTSNEARTFHKGDHVRLRSRR